MAARKSSRPGGNRPRTHPSQRRKPTPATPAVPTPDPAPSFSPDSAFARDLRRRLNLIHAVVMTVAFALERENAGHDGEFAVVLTRCAADPLWGVMADKLGAEDEDDEADGDEQDAI